MCYLKYAWSWMPVIFWYLQGLAAVAIAFFAVKIAGAQKKTNDLRSKLDLFDRRFRIYDRVREAIRAIVRGGGATEEELQKFYLDTLEADFVFRSDIRDYITQIYRRGEKLRSESEQIAARNKGMPSSIDPAKWATEHPADMKWITEQIETVKEKFKPYLDVSKL